MSHNMSLDQPLTLKNGVVIRNRLAKSAMSEGIAGTDASPHRGHETLYARWARGGLGLSITGNVMIDRRALGEPGNVVVEDERDLEALARWAQAGRENGTQLWMQLNHPGRQCPRGLNRESVAPSAVPFSGQLGAAFATPRELLAVEIEDLVERFGRAAAIAKKAGFTGVQIHGAHGYLVSQFLSPRTNQRSDPWGGTPEKRRRFVLEVYRAMRDAVGKDFPVSIKMNSADFQRGGITEDEALETFTALAEAGMDLIEISGGTYEAPAMVGLAKKSTRDREAYFLEFAERARRTHPVPLMVTGGFRTRQGMIDALASGALDMIGLARPLAMEPELPNRVLSGLDPKTHTSPVRTGLSLIDRLGILEINWYEAQLERMAEGKDPAGDTSATWALATSLTKMGLGGLRNRLRPGAS